MSPVNVMLLAAGEGQRLRPYTLHTPKPAIPLLGAPLMAYSVALLQDIKIGNFVVNAYHLPEKISELAAKVQPRCQREFQFVESPQLLGSGGGIHNAKTALVGAQDFLVLNADEVILPKTPGLLPDFLRAHKKDKAIATLMVMDHPEVGRKFGGVWTEPTQNQVRLFAKTNPGKNLTGFHFIGPMAFSDRIFHYFKNFDENGEIQNENILYDTLTAALAAGEWVQIFKVDCLWFETGNPQDFKTASKELNKILNSNESQFYPRDFLNEVLQQFGGQKPIIE